MDKRLVAVASELGNVRSLLEHEGFDVVDLAGTNLKDVNAVIVSSVSDDVMGIQTVETTAPVITANGRSADEILKDLEHRLTLQ